jgi:hypothetical protein
MVVNGDKSGMRVIVDLVAMRLSMLCKGFEKGESKSKSKWVCPSISSSAAPGSCPNYALFLPICDLLTNM